MTCSGCPRDPSGSQAVSLVVSRQSRHGASLKKQSDKQAILYGHTHVARVWTNRVRLTILLVVSWTKKMNISLSAFAPENLVSRDGFGSPVPRQPAHLHNRAELVLTYRVPSKFRGGVHFFFLNRHTPSGQSRVYRVTQLRTNGVHCRESAGTGPVNLKVVPNECCLARSPWTN